MRIFYTDTYSIDGTFFPKNTGPVTVLETETCSLTGKTVTTALVGNKRKQFFGSLSLALPPTSWNW